MNERTEVIQRVRKEEEHYFLGCIWNQKNAKTLPDDVHYGLKSKFSSAVQTYSVAADARGRWQIIPHGAWLLEGD